MRQTQLHLFDSDPSNSRIEELRYQVRGRPYRTWHGATAASVCNERGNVSAVTSSAVFISTTVRDHTQVGFLSVPDAQSRSIVLGDVPTHVIFSFETSTGGGDDSTFQLFTNRVLLGTICERAVL